MPDCTLCGKDDEVRASFGCDGPATLSDGSPADVFYVFCDCRGAREDCPRCKGEGLVGMRRCPLKLVEEAGPVGLRAAKAFRLYQHYESSGNLPVSGGTLEQSCTLMRAFEVAANERGRIVSDRRKHQAEEASAKAGGWR